MRVAVINHCGTLWLTVCTKCLTRLDELWTGKWLTPQCCKTYGSWPFMQHKLQKRFRIFRWQL